MLLPAHTAGQMTRILCFVALIAVASANAAQSQTCPDGVCTGGATVDALRGGSADDHGPVVANVIGSFKKQFGEDPTLVGIAPGLSFPLIPRCARVLPHAALSDAPRARVCAASLLALWAQIPAPRARCHPQAPRTPPPLALIPWRVLRQGA
jgi:hypothetical protein